MMSLPKTDDPGWAELYTKWVAAPPGLGRQKLVGLLVKKFEPMISGAVGRYTGLNLDDVQDLKQAARMGLMRALEMFDPTKREAFPPYALFWVRYYIRTELYVIRGTSTQGKAINLDAYTAHIGELTDEIADPEQVYLAKEDRQRWVEWLPEAAKVVNAPLDPHRNVQRSLHRKLVNRIEEDKRNKRREERFAKKPS